MAWAPPFLMIRAWVSEAARVVLPETTKPMTLWLPLPLFDSEPVTVTIALPDAGIATVTVGPAVARSANVALVVVWEVATVAPSVPEVPLEPVAPLAPVAPLKPVAPFEPVTPLAPVAPLAPVGPCAPAGPCVPAEPWEPVTPFAPVVPFAPVGPWAPAGPATP